MQLSPLKRFGLAALLWLPLAFFVWFKLASVFVWPVIQIAKLALLHVWPNFFLDVIQGADEINDATGQLIAHRDYWVQINSNILHSVSVGGQAPRLAFFDFTLNPLVYGYSIPLFAGLVMATPLDVRRRVLQIGAGLLLLWLAQAFGVVSEAFEVLGIKEGVEGAAAMAKSGYSLNAIALCYQFGYLILPPLVPAILWILFNRRFIEELTSPDAPPTS